MTLYDFFLLLHLFLFVYWLGGDIGVFYSSGYAVNSKLGLEARMTAANIMIGLDVLPRAAAAVMLTVGGVLSALLGVPHAPWQMALIILLAPAWLALELILHYRLDTPLGRVMEKIDTPFKVVLALVCVVSVAMAFADGRLAQYPWIGYKILIYVWLIICSIGINATIGPFFVGIHRIAQGKINADEDAAMAASLTKVRWAVCGIWVGIVFAAILGVVKPGTV